MDKELEKYLLGEDFNMGDITERQWKILEAAIEVFSEKGFDASRTSDIAKEAEVAEGTIFRYYKTKKDLLLGLMLPLIVKFFRPLILNSVEKIVEKDKDQPLEKLLADVFADRIALVDKNLPLVKTIAVEALYHPELLEPIRDKILPQAVGFISKMASENIEKGAIRDMDPVFIARSAMSLFAGYMVTTRLYPNVFPIEDEQKEIEKMVDLLLHGISNNKDGELM